MKEYEDRPKRYRSEGNKVGKLKKVDCHILFPCIVYQNKEHDAKEQ